MSGMVAPCGMNCERCYAYQDENEHCPGCRNNAAKVRLNCLRCSINKCDKKQNYCFECEDYPCERLYDLHLFYIEKYNIDIMTNLQFIRTIGEDYFLREQVRKYSCPNCGALTAVQNKRCFKCGKLIKPE